ncbi:SMI1/KNR4 family protein [Paenibacillaceae sp. P-4]|uniref:SMI1/KNR4 family protein n=1 Tax=Paenibacillaceae bacterium P-4 TaxID=3160969 RepID=UPI0032E82B9A
MSLIDELRKTIEGLLAGKVVDEDIEYFEEYKKITGVTDKQFDDFERDFSISLPTDFKAFYKLKDGSGYPLNLLYTSYKDSCIPFTFLSLDDIRDTKKFFCDRDHLMSEYYSDEEISKLDSRIKPYLFNKQWFPFAQVVGGSLYLMLDFDPTEHGTVGQVIFYVHDPDFVYFIAPTFSELLQDTIQNLEDDWYEECL